MTCNWCYRFTFLLFSIVAGTTIAIAADTPQIKAPPRTVADITELLNQYRPDPKKVEELREILNSQPPKTDSKKDLADHYLKKADAADALGAFPLSIENLRKVVEFGGANFPRGNLNRLSTAEARVGNLQSAFEVNQKYIDMYPAAQGGWVYGYGRKTILYTRLGDFESARNALEIAENNYDYVHRVSWWPQWGSTYTKAIELVRANFLQAQGKLVEAEAAARRALEAANLDERTNSWRGTLATPIEELQNFTDMSGGKLATILADQGKLTEAERVAREALERALQHTGAGSVHTAGILNLFAVVLQCQGRYIEAERIAAIGLRNLEQAGVVPDSSAIIGLRKLITNSLIAQGHYEAALIEHQKIYAVLGASPKLRSQLAVGDVDLALALLQVKRVADAHSMLDQLLTRNLKWLDANHPDMAELRGVKAMALVASGQPEDALVQFRLALPVIIITAISQGDEPSPLRIRRLKIILESYMSFLGEIHGKPIEQIAGIDVAGEAFKIADVLHSQNTQQAVVASAARTAVNDPQLGDIVRKEQDRRHEVVALYQILRDLMLAPPDQQLPKVIADMQKRIEGIRQERVVLQADIEKRFPSYANLIRPQPPSLAEARAVLRPNEALINLFTTDTGTYLWAFKKDGPVVFASAKLNRDELARLVQTLRKSLDPGEVDITTRIPEFDLDTAYRLYAELLAPVASGWQGATHLLVVANGALSQLPLAVLPTAKVTVKPDAKMPYEHFKEVPWLIRQAAFTYLPSVNALVALRKMPVASAQRSPFVGFGDPQFATTPVQVASTRSLRNLAVARPSQRDIEQAKPADWMDYSKIPPLPDTRDEILALAKALKADPDKDVFLGSQASKTNLMKLDLSKRRVVAFATHGLLPGDFPGVSEPSLALANPGNGQHGLLTLEDILSLKLDADWVVLSACNTAAGDGQGADALSGLGRAFFYAGSRALLVTHWPVESASARLLVTGIFERQAGDAKLSRAEALRQSMLALVQQKSDSGRAFSYAHPLFWAPYVLVGEGGI